jgi:hypothetical protein
VDLGIAADSHEKDATTKLVSWSFGLVHAGYGGTVLQFARQANLLRATACRRARLLRPRLLRARLLRARLLRARLLRSTACRRAALTPCQHAD